MTMLNKVDKYFKLNPDSIGGPDIYLGAKLHYHRTNNGTYACLLSPSKYAREAFNNCVKHLRENFEGKYLLPKEDPNSFMYEYEPNIDSSEPLNPEQASYFQSLIGVMRWMVEIGCIDISTKVLMISLFLSYPQEGHLVATLHIMAYLKQKQNYRLFLEPTYPVIYKTTFNGGADWKEFYGDSNK